MQNKTFLLLKKFKNTESAQLWHYIAHARLIGDLFNSILYLISHRAIQFYTVYQVIYVINKLYKIRVVFI